MCVQGFELNRNGELYIIRKPNLQPERVEGTSLAAAVVSHMIPEGAKAVLSLVLCERQIRVRGIPSDHK
jgi:aldehyde decarbonylase